MRRVWVLLVLLGGAAGCFSDNGEWDDGALQCSMPTLACPTGFACAYDGRCYRVGNLPVASIDAAVSCPEGSSRRTAQSLTSIPATPPDRPRR